MSQPKVIAEPAIRPPRQAFFSADRGAVLVAAAAAGLAVAARLVPAWFGEAPLINDAYYYTVTARNYVATGIYSFDGINLTNGFHPLWMQLLVLAFRLIGKDASLDRQVFAVEALDGLLFLAAVFAATVFWRGAVRKNQPGRWGFFLLLLFFLGPVGENYFTDGMESALLLLCFTLATGFFLTDRPAALAAALALLFLARLDTLVFFTFPLLVCLWWFRHRRRPWPAAAIGAPAGIVFLAYSISNYLAFGHVNTISGSLKSSFPRITPHFTFLLDVPLRIIQPGPTGMRLKLLLSPGLDHLVLLLAVVIVLTLRLRPARPVRDQFIALASILAALLLNLLLFQKWDKGIEAAYLSLPLAVAFPILGLALSPWIDRHEPAWGKWPARTAMAALFLLLAWQAAAAWSAATGPHRSVELNLLDPNSAEARSSLNGFLIHHTRPDDIIAATDAGGIGFWSRRRVVNLDGLINNFDYQDYLRAGRLREYLREKGVRYLKAGWWSGEQPFRLRRTEPMYQSRVNPAALAGGDYPPADFYVYSYLYDRFSDRIPLCPGQEVFRSAPFTDGGVKSVVVLYDLSRTCGSHAR